MKDRFPRTAREWGYMVLLGLLMISISNGCSTTAIKHIPSNEAALLTASLALWMAALGAVGPKGHDLPTRSIVGLLLGLGGVALLVWPRDTRRRRVISPGSCWCLRAGFSWAVGSILYRDAHLAIGPIAFNSVLMFFGATGSLAGGVALGQLPQMALGTARRAGAGVSRGVRLGGDLHRVRVADEERAHGSRGDVRLRQPGDRDGARLGRARRDARRPAVVGTLVILASVALVTLPSRFYLTATGRPGVYERRTPRSSVARREDFSTRPDGPIALDAAHDTTLTISAVPTAVQKPEIVNPGTIQATSPTMPGVQHQQEQAEREHRDRQRQDERERPHEGVDDAEQDRRPPRSLDGDREMQAAEAPGSRPTGRGRRSRRATGIRPCACSSGRDRDTGR